VYKLTLLLLILFFSGTNLAECTATQNLIGLAPEIKILPGTQEAGSMHLPMDNVKIKVPLIHNGLTLDFMEITEGEVANFYIPLAFNKTENFAIADISGYRDFLESFELIVSYAKGSCHAIQQSTLLHNQSQQ